LLSGTEKMKYITEEIERKKLEKIERVKEKLYLDNTWISLYDLDLAIEIIFNQTQFPRINFSLGLLSDWEKEKIGTISYMSLVDNLKNEKYISVKKIWRIVRCDLLNYLDSKQRKFRHIKFEEKTIMDKKNVEQSIIERDLAKTILGEIKRIHPEFFQVSMLIFSGVNVLDACYEVGISKDSFYRKKSAIQKAYRKVGYTLDI
jgi:hypothetical protein